VRIQLERRDLLQHPLKALDLVELTSAVPYFLPTSAALGMLASRPPRGDAVGVHVLDLGRTSTVRHAAMEPTTGTAGRHSPVPHLRGGHFRRVRVGPRQEWHYEVRWIAPTLVGGEQPDPNRLVVRRLPAPLMGGQERGGREQPILREGFQPEPRPFLGPSGPDHPRSLELP
jgi:hypothetical protein